MAFAALAVTICLESSFPGWRGATRPNQLHNLAAQVSGQLNSANDGRLFVQYSNGTIHDVWQNEDVFNGSQNVSGNFTTPSGVSSFQVGTEVVLDKGYLAFSSVVLRALSDPIAVTAGDDYQFDGQVAGALVAPVGQGGQIVARYSNAAGGDAGVDVLWDNPANFNGTAQVQQTFNANPGATTMRLMLITNLDAGHLTYSNFGLQHMVTGLSTIQRTTYSVAGQSVAVKVAGDPEPGNNGLFFLYSDHPSTGSGQVWAAPAPCGIPMAASRRQSTCPLAATAAAAAATPSPTGATPATNTTTAWASST